VTSSAVGAAGSSSVAAAVAAVVAHSGGSKVAAVEGADCNDDNMNLAAAFVAEMSVVAACSDCTDDEYYNVSYRAVAAAVADNDGA
jgi:hypothetical protein